MKYHYAIVRAEAECMDCDWKTDCYNKDAQVDAKSHTRADAKRHAKKYGHTVKGELIISFGYYGNEEKGD